MEILRPNEDIAIGSAPDAMLPRPYAIRKLTNETHDTFSLELQPDCDDQGFSFSPGQFNMLYVLGVGEVPISISGDPAKPERLTHTLREVGAVTRAMRRLKAGGWLGVRGPYGSSWPISNAERKDVVLVTGGIGLAPLRPVIYHILANRDHYGKIVLLYGARTPDDILYEKELEKWRSRFDLEIHITVDRATGSWCGNVGVVTQLITRSPFDAKNCVAMVCGPEIMMRFTILELERRGVNLDNIYVSMERNMKCGIGLCGHCQVAGSFVCKNGPVYRYDELGNLLMQREV
ncbi:MAG: FAD/NAD(P)-binding protein [candidate division Zixibacteria bacterium]|nr:FAD/NAD(P)-binding protein [candidate division Zixibacteria bacterium]MBU1470860.1 FAD/NAD(P)-binding protein [candidate division Zixibacteria bacterium]MBU2625720.1 FAD/NAD(P)-binding protein [candidate division Zixibacteria bacterium]